MTRDILDENKNQKNFSNQKDCLINNEIKNKKNEESEFNKSSIINLAKYSKENIEISKEYFSRIKIPENNKFYISKEINKGPWSPKENNIIIEYVKQFGEKNWNKCAEFIMNRTGKQCREHWKNCLNPKIKKGEWTLEEDLFIMLFYKKCHGSWRELIHLFENRTENSIKNRFFSQLRKIAANDLNINKKRSSKMDLKNLIKYLEQGIEEAKNNFMSKNKMTEEDFKNYLKKIENKLNNKRKDKKKKKKIINNNDNYNLLGKKREKNLNEKNKEIKIEEKVIEKKIKEEANESTKTSELSNHNLIKKEESKKENKEIKDNKIIKNEQYYGQDSSDESDDYNNINSFLEINQKNALNNSLNYLEQNEFENMEETFGNSEENFKESFKSYEPEYIRTNSDIISRLSKNYFFPL